MISTRRPLPIALPGFEWAAWAAPIWSECNAVALVDFSSEDFRRWLLREVIATSGIPGPKKRDRDERRPERDAKPRADFIRWVSKTPLQLMQSPGHRLEPNSRTQDIINRILFPPLVETLGEGRHH